MVFKFKGFDKMSWVTKDREEFTTNPGALQHSQVRGQVCKWYLEGDAMA